MSGSKPRPETCIPPDAPSAPLGPQFVLDGSRHARIRIDASACRANYQWTVSVQYIVTGEKGIREVALGPFESYAVADHTVQYVGYQDPSGDFTGSHSVVTGPHPGSSCHR